MVSAVTGDEQQKAQAFAGPRSAPPTNSNRMPGRNNLPTRASTVGSPDDLDRKKSSLEYLATRSDDLNHAGSSRMNAPQGSPSPAFLSPSRPLTPADSRSGASSSNHSENGAGSPKSSGSRRPSVGSTDDSRPFASSKSAVTLPASSPSGSTTCASCSLPLEGAFVRALGNVWHLQCFKCKVNIRRFRPSSGITDLLW